MREHLEELLTVLVIYVFRAFLQNLVSNEGKLALIAQFDWGINETYLPLVQELYFYILLN